MARNVVCIESMSAPIWGAKHGKIGAAKDDAPVRANVRGIRHSTPVKALEQQVNSRPSSRQTALGGV